MSALALFGSDRAAAIEELHAATALYTVEGIVDGLLRRVGWPHPTARLIDPSCGDGIFLARALHHALDADSELRQHPGRLTDRISGWEIHPGACAAARERICQTLANAGIASTTADRLANTMVTNADFLTEGPTDGRFDLVIGNPPYLRFANLPQLLRDDYTVTVPAFARNDMLHSFLERCARALSPTGQIACVSSDRWLSNKHAGQLRNVLGSSLAITHLTRLDAASAFYRPKYRRAGTPPRIHPIEIVLDRSGLGTTLSATPIYPGSEGGVEHATTLSDVADISIAPYVGTFGGFVIDGDTAVRFSPADLIPAIDTDDILSDDSVGPIKRFVLRTTPAHEPPQHILDHLSRTRASMCARAKTRRAWWVPPERVDTCSLDEPVIVIPRIANHLRAIIVPAGILPINHNLTIIRARSTSVESLRDAILTSENNAWLLARADRLENGYFSILTGLLRSLPIDQSHLS